jgi:essential nuclear protein 1
MPKAPSSRRAQQHRHNPLEHDIVETGLLRNKPSKRKERTDDERGDGFVDSKASRKILRIGRELLEEDEEGKGQAAPGTPISPPQSAPDSFAYASRADLVAADEAYANGHAFDDEDGEDDGEDAEEWGDDDDGGEVEELEIDPADLATYRKFLPEAQDPLLTHGWDQKPAPGEAEEEEGEGEGGGTNLADLIMAKIAEYEAANGPAPAPVDDLPELSPKIVAVYTQYVHAAVARECPPRIILP